MGQAVGLRALQVLKVSLAECRGPWMAMLNGNA